MVVPSTSPAETLNDAYPVLHVAILAHLPLAFQPRDKKAETYDAAQHGLYVGVWGIRRRPRYGFIPLLLGTQLSYMAQEPVFFVNHFGASICVHGRKIPSRHDLSVESFGGIPAGRDVALGSLTDHQRLAVRSKVFAMRIGTRKMAFDDSARPIVLEDSRQVTGIETGRPSGYECGKRSSTHQGMHLGDVLDTKIIRQIHDESP